MYSKKQTRKILGNFLKDSRGRTSLQEISKRLAGCGISLSDSTLSRIENGKIGTHVDLFPFLCRAYNVQLADLIDALPKINPQEKPQAVE